MEKLKVKLKEIKDRCDMAIEGPWYDEEKDYPNYCLPKTPKGYLFINDDVEAWCDKNTGKFIIESRSDVPMLLEMVEELIKQRNKYVNTYKLSKGFKYGDLKVFTGSLDEDLEKIAEKYK